MWSWINEYRVKPSTAHHAPKNGSGWGSDRIFERCLPSEASAIAGSGALVPIQVHGGLVRWPTFQAACG